MVPNSKPLAFVVVAALLAGWGHLADAARVPAAESPDPFLVIPSARTAPKIDGKLDAEEWQFAAAVTGFEAYNAGIGMRAEQVIVYASRDEKNLYVAMDSVESNTNRVVAACVRNDYLRIIGDDCLELMVAPGTQEDANRFDFPTFYIAANSIGTLWDARFVPLCAETHNSWSSNAEIAHQVDGTRWTTEMRVPFASISKEPPKDGQVWRMNFDRTYYGYFWSAWKKGALNDARTGGDAMFDSRAPAVRLLSVNSLINGAFQMEMEIANGTTSPQTVKLAARVEGEDDLGTGRLPVGKDEKEVTVPPGKVELVMLGKKERLRAFNQLSISATQGEKRLLAMERTLYLPAPRFEKKPAPEVQLVYIFPRFLASQDRIAVLVDYSAWAKKLGYFGDPPVAHICVWPKGKESEKPVLEGTLSEYANNKGTWRASTEKLAEGEYVVNVCVTAGKSEIANWDDWFEKRVFDWMTRKAGVGEDVPKPYTPVEVGNNELRVWGRAYQFAPSGLPIQLTTQKRPWLSAPVDLVVEVGGKSAKVDVKNPVSFKRADPRQTKGRSRLQAGNLQVDLESTTEFDGFTLYRLTYQPVEGSVDLSRMRIRVPLRADRTKFYSASGDPQGVEILGEVFPDKQGKILDSLENLRSVCCSPTFATLFWVADYETSFCYAADNDKGWILRDDAPALEVIREGDTVNLWLNLVHRKVDLKEPRTLEFALMTGPTRPLPEGWRGVQQDGIFSDCPTPLVQIGGSGNTLAGGTNFIHPGHTPEQIQKSKELIQTQLDRGYKAVVGYHYWGTVPKGFPEARVFRSEWGIDKVTWESARHFADWAWKSKFFGDNKENYTIVYVQPVPSYVDFISHAYDLALQHTALTGFYDDTGYPKPVFDPELNIGFVREDGREVYSSGLWVYRDRWMRAAYLNYKHNRPNFLGDSQHVGAHHMPAYHFIGRWAPCERGFYNPFPDRDNLGFYQSMGRYVAVNAARQFGQAPSMIGMSTTQWEVPRSNHDTRSMMMLALLNDQDVGSFGHRDMRTTVQVRHARNLFRPWEKDVEFTGYWESAEFLKCDTPGVLVSLYRSPRGVLFMLGNVGETETEAQVQPQWKKLGLVPSSVKICDAETGGEPGLLEEKGFAVLVPPHDLRIVVAGVLGAYEVKAVPLGTDLPKPKEVLTRHSESFDTSELCSTWQKDLHEGNAAAGAFEGRLYVQGASYGYSHVRREFGEDNVSVQCMIARAPSGTNDEWGGSLFLIWPNGEFVQATPGTSQGKFLYMVSGRRRAWGQPIGREEIPGLYPNLPNWVKVTLRADRIDCFSSRDGNTWIKDVELPRDDKLAGAPQFLFLGNGGRGEAPHLDNVMSQHFNPNNPVTTFFDDLVVGRE